MNNLNQQGVLDKAGLSALEQIKLGKQLASAIKERDTATSAVTKLKISKVVQDLRKQLGLLVAKAAPKTASVVQAAGVALAKIRQFLPNGQYKFLQAALLKGGDAEYYAEKVSDLANAIKSMPRLRETENSGDATMVGVHYFGSNIDIYLTELESEREAFGLVDLHQGYGPELGYLKLNQYLAMADLNIDLNWRPVSIAALQDGGIDDDDGELSLDDVDELTPQDEAALVAMQTKKDTSHFYEYLEKTTTGSRQKANNAAIALLKQFQSGERDQSSITDEDRAILAKYTGSGGNLTTADGKKGSAYEYYTPKPIAEGMWQLAADLGFAGGKVLDPCAGVGIFGATAPKSAIVDAVELDEVSGGINGLVNGGVGHNVTVSPFELVAANTPDETHDCVVSNVPFGANSARGGNQMHDSKYQKDSLEAYFMLRMMDKLKPNGLAMFIVPPRVVSGRQESDTKLRHRLSLKGEFKGAYRLPNSVFGAADADTITDIVVFKKHSRETLDRIEQLYGTNTDALREAKVLWSDFTDGQYFKTEGIRFVLGEFKAKDPAKYRDIDRVINDQSVANIGKLLRKFGVDTRIDFDVLDIADAGEPIVYQDGDTLALNGQILTFKNGEWVAEAKTLSATETVLHKQMANIGSALDVVNGQMSWENFSNTIEYMHNIGKTLDVPAWAANVHATLKKDSKAAALFDAIVTGLAAKEAQEAHASDADADLVALYPTLANSMKKHYRTKVPTSFDSQSRSAVKFIGIHYTAKGGFSDYWQGKREATVVNLTADKQLAKTQYITGTLNIAFNDAKAIVEADGGVFDPLNDDDWMMSADGKTVIRSDDFFVGNVGEALAKLDDLISQAKDDAIKAKMQRMKIVAHARGNPLNLDKMYFDMRSPMVKPDEALEFFKAFVGKDCHIRQNEKNKKQFVDVDIAAGDDVNKKLLNRIGDYMKNGSVTLGGIDTSPLTEEEALTKLDQLISQYNTQFNTWVKSNPNIMGRLKAIADDPHNIYFHQVNDKSPFAVDGISPEWDFHGYQHAFARRMGRNFSGVNGFDVGLGKTATALMSVQYVQSIGVKKKTLFLVPGSVLSNWRKEAVKGEGNKGQDGYKAPVYASDDGCLFVGLNVDKDGNAKVSSKDYDRDLNVVLENKHNKVFMSYEAFIRIRLKDATVDQYSNYLRRVDESYAEAVKAAENEKNKSKLAKLIDTIKGNKASTAAPFFEDMGFDSIVIDEAHALKNSKQTVDFKGGKFLSSAEASTMGLDAQAKVWFIRQENANGDGVLALTATPITNSPLEIYSMLTLAVGEERVNKMMLGATGADAFMEMVCSFEEQQEETVEGKLKSYRTFTGLRNLDALRQGLHDIAVIENAESVGNDFTIPEAPETATPVALAADTEAKLLDYKIAYTVAREIEMANKSNRQAVIDPEEMEVFLRVQNATGESNKLLSQPFNLISKMNKLIVDPELDESITVYHADNAKLANKVCETYNKKKITAVRSSIPVDFDAANIKTTKILKDDEKDVIGTEYTVYTTAQYDGERIVLDSVDFDAQMALDKIIDDLKLDVAMTISPKFAALIANVKQEMAHPRGLDGVGRTQKSVKQIIFCDMLSSHIKIKRLLAKHCGIPASKITFISGRFNNEPEALLDVQAGFNATDEENVYQIIIGNKKAEVGINLQKGCQAIHHLTIGWTPDSLQQRNGRGVRQGNKTGYVSIYHYDADGTFDTYRRRLVNKKSEWIDALMSKSDAEEVEITGGLTREQQEALIGMVGNTQAMADFEKTVENQERARRTLHNRANQEVNIKTAIAATDFLRMNAEFSRYAQRKMSEFEKAQKVLKQAIETLDKSIGKGVKEVTIANNRKRVELLQQSIMPLFEMIASAYAVNNRYNDKEPVSKEDLYESLIEKGNYASGFSYALKENEPNLLQSQWEVETQTNQSMLAAATRELDKSYGKTGAFNSDLVAFALKGEVVRYKGDMFKAGSVIKYVQRGKPTWCLLDWRLSAMKARYFDIDSWRDGTKQYNTDTYGTYLGNIDDWLKDKTPPKTLTAEEVALNEGYIAGIYAQGTPEYQEALSYFAAYDNDMIAYNNGQLTEKQQQNLASAYLPEVAKLHSMDIEQVFAFSPFRVKFKDDSLFPVFISDRTINYASGSDSAKLEAFKSAHMAITKSTSEGLVVKDPEIFEKITTENEYVSTFLAGMVAYGVKMDDWGGLYQINSSEVPYSQLPASQERAMRVCEAIKSAKVDDVGSILDNWIKEAFEPYVHEIPSQQALSEFLKKRTLPFKSVEWEPVFSALDQRIKDSAFDVKEEPEAPKQTNADNEPAPVNENGNSSNDEVSGYVYLMGDTWGANKGLGLRAIAKKNGFEIGWYPEKKQPSYADKQIVQKAKNAPPGVWVFERKMWVYLQENHASDVARFNLTVKEGN